MPERERIQTGADWRLKRLRQMMAHIATHGDEGVTTIRIKGFMGMKFGLKFPTTATYIAEMHEAGLITQNDHGKWIVTAQYKRLKKVLYSE